MSTKFTNLLNNIQIASPCSQNWEEMMGDNRRRYCGECKLNVYNLSGMSKIEAENLIFNTEGRLCVRFYRRADGSVITRDCPVGLQALKKRLTKTATAFVSLIFGLFGALGFMSLFNQPKREIIMGAMTYKPTPMPAETPEITMGEIEVMGNIAIPTPTPKIKKTSNAASPEMVFGRIAINKTER